MNWYFKEDGNVNIITMSQMFNLSVSMLLIRPLSHKTHELQLTSPSHQMLHNVVKQINTCQGLMNA